MPITSGGGYPKSSYKDDESLFSTPFLRFWMAVGLILACLFPFLASRYQIHLINLVWTACIGALGLNIVSGYAGLLSLGTGGFLCAGAFTAAVLSSAFKAPFWLSVIAGTMSGAFLGLIAGLPALRLKGIYLILSTLAVQFVTVYACSYYQIKEGFTGGIPLPRPNLGAGFLLDSPLKWYFFLGAVLGIVTIFCINLERTHWGRAWMAIRDRDVAAHILGVNLGYFKLWAFVFSSAVIGLAGVLSAYYKGFATYEEFTIWLSIYYVAMILIGGRGSIMGSFLGAFVVTLLPYLIRWVIEAFNLPMGLGLRFSAVEFAVFGLLLIIMVLLERQGLAGIWRLRIRPYFELWPFRYRRAIAARR